MSAPDARCPNHGALLFRVDYGHPDALPSWAHAWKILDLSRHLLSVVSEKAPSAATVFSSPNPAPGWVLRNADRLLAWGRLRGKGHPLGEVCRIAALCPVLLQCRFPRHASALRRALEDAGVFAFFRETPRDGSLPPAYRTLAQEDPRLGLHLELEWYSAIAFARGDAALEQVGLFLARAGPRGGSSVASALGITPGAARSYLQWMEDVALVRREGRLFDLAHPLLRLRFAPCKPLNPHPSSGLLPRQDEMSVD